MKRIGIVKRSVVLLSAVVADIALGASEIVLTGAVTRVFRSPRAPQSFPNAICVVM